MSTCTRPYPLLSLSLSLSLPSLPHPPILLHQHPPPITTGIHEAIWRALDWDLLHPSFPLSFELIKPPFFLFLEPQNCRFLNWHLWLPQRCPLLCYVSFGKFSIHGVFPTGTHCCFCSSVWINKTYKNEKLKNLYGYGIFNQLAIYEYNKISSSGIKLKFLYKQDFERPYKFN